MSVAQQSVVELNLTDMNSIVAGKLCLDTKCVCNCERGLKTFKNDDLAWYGVSSGLAGCHACNTLGNTLPSGYKHIYYHLLFLVMCMPVLHREKIVFVLTCLYAIDPLLLHTHTHTHPYWTGRRAQVMLPMIYYLSCLFILSPW